MQRDVEQFLHIYLVISEHFRHTMDNQLILSEQRHIKSEFLQLIKLLFYQHSPGKVYRYRLQQGFRLQSFFMRFLFQLLERDTFC